MPRNEIGNTPFSIRTLDSDQPLTLQHIRENLGDALGVSLCIRSVNGPTNRGGYFFHFRRNNADFQVLDIENNLIGTLNPDDLVRFINHVSGRQFDADMLLYCQSEVNFRQDQIEGDSEA